MKLYCCLPRASGCKDPTVITRDVVCTQCSVTVHPLYDDGVQPQHTTDFVETPAETETKSLDGDSAVSSGRSLAK